MSLHLDFECKACIHSYLLCCIYSWYGPALTMHRCSLTQGPFAFQQDLQRSADCISFSHDFPPLLLFFLHLCVPVCFLLPFQLMPLSCSWDLSTAALTVPCPRAQGNICEDPSSYGTSHCFSSLCVATIWKQNNRAQTNKQNPTTK